jgi:hypothetical protein
MEAVVAVGVRVQVEAECCQSVATAVDATCGQVGTMYTFRNKFSPTMPAMPAKAPPSLTLTDADIACCSGPESKSRPTLPALG